MSYSGIKNSSRNADLVNYIENGKALNGTAGWNAYADAAGAAPVDGTGGSPQANLFVTTTSNPLRGAVSFNLQKTGSASRQGQGISYDFTIDNADLAKVLSVTFDYSVLSGTYADGDLTVYIIADPSGTPQVIQPAGYTILAGTTNIKLKQTATFQTLSNVTSYRLCLHIASTSAQNYTLAIDTVRVGPQVTVYGPPVSDWQSYTPTIVNFGPSGSVTVKGYYRRVGANLEVAIDAIQTANFSSSVGAVQINIIGNLGLSFDTSKLATNSINGYGQINGSSFAVGYNLGETHVGRIEQIGTSTNTVRLCGDDGAQEWNTAVSVPAAWAVASLNAIRLYASVPIAGWSSNTVMSSDTDTRVVAATARRAAAAIHTSSGSFQTVVFDTKISDTHGAFNNSTGIYTVPVSGFYRISSTIGFVGNSTGIRTVNALITTPTSAASYNLGNVSNPNATYASLVNGSITVSVNAGDTIAIRAFQSSGTSLTYITDGTDVVPTVSIERLSGPATIAASETVAMLYTGAPPTGSIGAALNTVTMGTRITDSHNAYSGGVYTVPVSGRYSIVGSIGTNASFSSGSLSTASILIDNAERYTNYFQAETGPTIRDPVVQISVHSVPLLAGQTIRLGCFINATSPSYSSSGTVNYLSIVRVGN